MTFCIGVGFGEGSDVVLGPVDMAVDDVVFTEFVGAACLAGECSTLSFVYEVARDGKLCWRGGWC